MNESLALLTDTGKFEWWPFASAALAIAVGSYLFNLVQRRQNEVDKREAAEKEILKAGIVAAIGLRIEAEVEERRNAVAEECDARRKKDDDLGKDISSVREELAYHFGKAGKARPNFGARPQGSD